MQNDTQHPNDEIAEAENEVIRRAPKVEAAIDETDDSLWWIAAFCGLMLTIAGGFVLAETLQILAQGTAAWSDCIRTSGDTLFSNCSGQVDVAFEYRYGLNGLLAMGLAIAACFIGPVPIIAAFSRYRNNWLGAIMFFVVLIPYGTLAFVVLIVGVVVMIFYSVQITPTP
jgi:hypothetical protein